MSKVTRSYKVGIRLQSDDKVTRRINEKIANQRVRDLQEEALTKIKSNNCMDHAIDLAKSRPNLKGTSAASKLGKRLNDRSNLGQSSFLLAFNAAKGYIDREDKLSQFFSFLRQEFEQAIEWLIFGRCPYTENRLAQYLDLNYNYSRNLILSARRVVDTKIVETDKSNTTELSSRLEQFIFDNKLNQLSKAELSTAINSAVDQKSKEFGSNISKRQNSFLNKLKLLKNHSQIVILALQHWLDSSDTNRWKKLKTLSMHLPEMVDARSNLHLFSALRYVVVLAFSYMLNDMEESVIELMRTLQKQPHLCLTTPFEKSTIRYPPISLVMGSKYVVQRPGNSNKLTQLAKTDGQFALKFPKRGSTKLVAIVRLHNKLLQYLDQGARIRMLQIHAGDAPALKVIVTVIMEGEEWMFYSTKLVNQFCEQLKEADYTFNHDILGIDINRIGKHMVSFSESVTLPGSIMKLIDRWNSLSRYKKKFSNSFTHSIRIYNEDQVIKRRGELQRIYRRQNNLLKQIHIMVTAFVAAVLIVGGYNTLRLENLNLTTRGSRGALARAIASMPSDETLYYRSAKLAKRVAQKEIRVELISNDGRSKFHVNCGGKLARSLANWDIAGCGRCGKDVNTHRNAARKLLEVDADHLIEVVPVRIPGTVVD